MLSLTTGFWFWVLLVECTWTMEENLTTMSSEAYVVDTVSLCFAPRHIVHGATDSERHNEVFAQMLQKTIDDDPRMPLESALRHVVFAKNCLENYGGFTPYQLMLGKNPRVHSLLQEKTNPPALEVRSDSKTVADHFNLLEKNSFRVHGSRFFESHSTCATVQR